MMQVLLSSIIYVRKLHIVNYTAILTLIRAISDADGPAGFGGGSLSLSPGVNLREGEVKWRQVL